MQVSAAVAEARRLCTPISRRRERSGLPKVRGRHVRYEAGLSVRNNLPQSYLRVTVKLDRQLGNSQRAGQTCGKWRSRSGVTPVKA